MKTSLIIVESPAKARTLTKYLGKGFEVKATVGHVIDLPRRTMGVDIENDFQPRYEILPNRKKVVSEIKNAAKDAEEIYLAPDPDREGEAIAWHIAKAIGDGKKKIYRVRINEITKKAVEEAIRHPGELDQSLFDAQQARRILDRLVGYNLSPLLQGKVRKGLSAGRVQSVTVRLVCEREEEIRSFVIKEYWTIEASLRGSSPPDFTAKLVEINKKKAEISDEVTAKRVAEELENGKFTVGGVIKKELRRFSPPPFITAKLQQDAARKLRFSARKTMMLAQRLYEGIEIGDEGSVGLITYMRTDSTRVSAESQAAAREVILSRFGKEYLPSKPPVYKSKKGAQGAHEAIRPTSTGYTPEMVAKYLDKDLAKLYELIYNRFLASQMARALFDQTSVNIENDPYLLRATNTVLKFKGFMAVYREDVDEGEEKDEEERALSDVKKGEVLSLLGINSDQHFTKPPPRYTEASLVKELEEKGIGRPSTYAQIMGTIQEREYVAKEKRNFYPTELGCLVNELLVESFPNILNIKFTAQMEDDLDKIEEGKLGWVDALKSFYEPFNREFQEAKIKMRNVKKEREEITDIACELCGKPMIVKWGRKGEFLACSGFPKCKNSMNFKRSESGEVQPITPLSKEEKGAEAPSQTGISCEKCGKQMVIRSGKRGEFLACPEYPRCMNTKNFTRDESGQIKILKEVESGEVCEKCGKPMAIKRGKWGSFLACTGYPGCRNTKKIKQASDSSG